MDDLNELPENVARAMRALEQDADRAAARVNTAKVAGGVLKQLREVPVADIALRPSRPWLRIAAAVALLLAGGAVARRISQVPGGAMASVGLPMEWRDSLADSLVSTETQALLTLIDSGAVQADSVSATRVLLEDLNETELQTLLQSLETSEGTI